MQYSQTSILNQSPPARASRAPQRVAATIERACVCPGCPQHIKRLEDLNAQLARDNDRLRGEVETFEQRLRARKEAA